MTARLASPGTQERLARLFAGVGLVYAPPRLGEPTPPPAAAGGPQLWRELHEYAFRYPEHPSAETAQAARGWLAAFARRVPIVGCGCRSEWQGILRRCPPPLDSQAGFYWWTVAAHDWVNRRLGKPLAAPAWSRAHPIFTLA